jgi:NitT/TauT family transport system substrate-binding protein
VTYRLKWLFNVSVAGSLYAQEHGIFEDHGLRVTLKEGGPERDAIKELELGHAQFGVASGDQVIRALSKGAPVVVIAQLFQANPLQWIYRPKITPFKAVQDLRGKTIGITYGGNDETIMRAILNKYHIRNDEVRLFSVRYDYTPFYEAEVDFWPVYQNAEGVVIGAKLRKGGEPTAFVNPDALGIRLVANAVITTETLCNERPQLINVFVRALLRGWQMAIDPANEDKTVEATRQFDRDTPVRLIRKQLIATRDYVRPPSGMEIGTIDVKAWTQTESIMLAQDLIPEPVCVERALRSPQDRAKAKPPVD